MAEENNNNNDSKFRKRLYNEITLGLAIVSLIGVILSVTFFITKPDIEMDKELGLLQKDVDTILNNHLYHINLGLTDLKKNQKGNTSNINSININIAKILTKLEIE